MRERNKNRNFNANSHFCKKSYDYINIYKYFPLNISQFSEFRYVCLSFSLIVFACFICSQLLHNLAAIWNILMMWIQHYLELIATQHYLQPKSLVDWSYFAIMIALCQWNPTNQQFSYSVSLLEQNKMRFYWRKII